MNLQILKWLVAHRDVLTKVVDLVKGYSNDLPPLKKWEIVDSVARLVIPLLSPADIRAMADIDWDDDEKVTALGLGAEYAALGFDWQTLVKVIIPILQIILEALSQSDG